MDRRGEIKTGTIFVLFVGIIIGLIFLGVIANSVSSGTTKQVISNENKALTTCMSDGAVRVGEVNESNPLCNYTVAHAPTGWRTTGSTGCGLSSLTITNRNGTALTLNTDYTADLNNGIISYRNTTATKSAALGASFNTTLVSYSYCQDEYIPDSSSRNVFSLITFLAVLGVIVFAVYYLYKKGALDFLRK